MGEPAPAQNAVRPVDQPIAWVGADRLLLDDVTRYGLHRLVYAKKEECPDAQSLLAVARRRANGARVHAWAVEIDEFWYLWICWKDQG